MYVKCTCPYCDRVGYHFISVDFEEENLTESEFKKYVLENIKVKHSQTEEEILKMI